MSKPVIEMFDQIAPIYDRTNRILSFGIDLYWRAKVRSLLPNREKLKLLDCATGTGDQLLSILKNKNIHQAIGIDLSEEMLKMGREKLHAYSHKVTLQKASATELPYLDNTFDAATISFGIRNIPDVQKCLQEIYRVLQSHGRVLILEFSLPKHPWIQKAHLFYLNDVLPYIGQWISGNKDAYSYLSKTIQSFPYGEAFCKLLIDAGFKSVKAFPLTGGIVTIYQGEK